MEFIFYSLRPTFLEALEKVCFFYANDSQFNAPLEMIAFFSEHFS